MFALLASLSFFTALLPIVKLKKKKFVTRKLESLEEVNAIIYNEIEYTQSHLDRGISKVIYKDLLTTQ